MTGILDFKAGRFRAIKDGRVAFDTDTPAARLAPSEKLVLSAYDIEFPDLWKGVYYTTNFSHGGIGGTFSGGASSYAALVGQEWGPSEPSPNNLPDIVLGAAPPGANYLNIRANLTRTVTPAKVAADITIPGNIRQGKWTRFEGSSCALESFGALRRTVDILIDSGDIILRRRQSVRDTDGTVQRLSSSYSTADGQHFYYLPGTPGSNAGYSTGHYASLGEFIGSGTSGGAASDLNPGGSDAPSTNTSGKSYRSVWTGDIEITPGRVG